MDRVLVTGGAGFIGSHVVDRLCKRGMPVTVLEPRAVDRRIDGADVFLGDVRDREAVVEAVGHHDGVIHLAGVLGTQETIDNPALTTQVNVIGSLNVYEACRMHGRNAVYLSVGNYWVNNSYAISKSIAERFAFMYNKEFGTKIAVVRGYNIYGPRQKAKPVRKVVPNFILPALKGEDLTVYGSGSQVMDVIYVEDVAEILIRALLLPHGVHDRALEAGMGLDTTINDLAAIVIRASASTSQVRHVPMRPGETPGTVVKADIDTLAVLGYSRADMTSIEEGIARTVAWFREELAARSA